MDEQRSDSLPMINGFCNLLAVAGGGPGTAAGGGPGAAAGGGPGTAAGGGPGAAAGGGPGTAAGKGPGTAAEGVVLSRPGVVVSVGGCPPPRAEPPAFGMLVLVSKIK